jgi:CRISPR-associated protein Cmr5
VAKEFEKEGKKNEYRQEAQQLPSRIQACGLGQTLAFYASKKGIHQKIGDRLARFVSGDEKKSMLTFLEDIMSASSDSATYRRRTREALAYAEWLKRYTKALIEE